MGVALLTHRFPACLGYFFHGVKSLAGYSTRTRLQVPMS